MAYFNLKPVLLTAVLITQLGWMNSTMISIMGGSNAIGDCFAYTPKKKSFMKSEMKKEFSLKRNLANFNRASGLLTDILREQKRLFSIQNSSGTNKISLKAENLLNEANMHASEENYDKGYEALETANKILLESIEKLNKNKK